MYFVDRLFKVRSQYDPRITLNHTNEHQIEFCAPQGRATNQLLIFYLAKSLETFKLAGKNIM